MGRKNTTEGEKEAAGRGRVTTPRKWGETLGAARPLECAPIPTEWSGRRGDVRPPEWRKSLGGSAMEWKGGSSRPRTTRTAKERAGGSSSHETI